VNQGGVAGQKEIAAKGDRQRNKGAWMPRRVRASLGWTDRGVGLQT
jgi:hypothetical protein